MITKDEALAHAAVLEKYSRGYGMLSEVEAALAQLSRIDQVNVRENIMRFRAAMKQRRPIGGMSAQGWQIRAAHGVRDALLSFVFPAGSEGEDVQG